MADYGEEIVTEIELALSVAEMAANGILEEWTLNMDRPEFTENPANIAVYNLAKNTLSAITEYRANRIVPLEEAAIEAIEDL